MTTLLAEEPEEPSNVVNLSDFIDDVAMFDQLMAEHDAKEAAILEGIALATANSELRSMVRSVRALPTTVVRVPNPVVGLEPNTNSIHMAYLRGYRDALAQAKALLE